MLLILILLLVIKDAKIKVLETDITDIKGMLKDIAKEKIKAEVGIK